MKAPQRLALFLVWLGVAWALTFTPATWVNLQQYLFRGDYRLVWFEVEQLRAVSGYPYAAWVVGRVEGREESMGLGHFYRGEILPADAERRFAPGKRIRVYYDPALSNFTINSRTARFVAPERYRMLSATATARMLLRIYGPLLLAVSLWLWLRRREQVARQRA